MDRSTKNEIITEGHLDFLQDLYEQGLTLKISEIQELVKAKRINLKDTDLEINAADDTPFDDETEISRKSIESQEADDGIIIIDEKDFKKTGKTYNKHVQIADDETFDRLQESALFHYDTDNPITKADWAPHSVIDHSMDFVIWINSINSGFQNMTMYTPFRKYCQQAKNWLEDPDSISDYETLDEKRDYCYEEMRRCQENTLYFLDKYLMLKEGDMKTGTMKYLSKPAHKVIAFLMDCGYSMMVGKGRQMAASSTFGGCALAKILFNKNFFLKFIAQDDVKSKEIVNDKIKYPFGELPYWMKPSVGNDREEVLRFVAKTKKKGTKKGLNSSIMVVPPSVGAINGGSPQCVFIDEAGYIGMLRKMIKEARPTMFMYDEDTKKLKMTRQIVIWGTGGTEEGDVRKKTKAYEVEYYDCLDHWNKRDYNYGIIPIFFDWTARPGMTRKMYLQEKRSYTKEGPEKDASIIQFKQHYPSTPQDMFLNTGKLLVSADWINKQMDRIRDAGHMFKSKKGYFEPIFDRTKQMSENSDVPYAIIGANFIPLDETKDDMASASVEIFMEPDKSWRDRYYQGTDPIMTDNGYSNMASAIYDAHFNTISAVVNFRADDHKYTFLQTMLLGLYYNTNDRSNSVPEVLESNIGTAYADYKEEKGFYKSLVHRKELPDYLAGGGSLIGIDNKGNRAKFIIHKLIEFTTAYGRRVYIYDFFKQMETFTCTVTPKGQEVWGVSDKRQFQDDVLYAVVFSYICRLTYDFKQPYQISSETGRYVIKNKRIRAEDGTLMMVPQRVKVYN